MPNYWRDGEIYANQALAPIPNIAAKPESETKSENNNCCCPSTTKFFEDLVIKLEEMTLSLKVQFEELRNQCPDRNGREVVLADIKVNSPPVIIKQEYFIYVQRYGPPVDGKFDETLLNKIRSEE